MPCIRSHCSTSQPPCDATSSLAATTHYHACRTIKEGPEEGALESEDAFIRNTRGLLRFYGAVLQYSDTQQAWRYVASFVNTMPANVYTGTALVAFLETAGFALGQRFGRQFQKLLQARCPSMH